jgi:hypothetical protein
MSKAVRRAAIVSATIRVSPGGGTMIELGKWRSSATAVTEPSGSTRISGEPAGASPA